ncbi:MAG: DUF5114 domain-containing protein [Tannerellaceae bacterium]|nr:DUF5114 domain-containing protein [Tannerellaceae bacterium]
MKTTNILNIFSWLCMAVLLLSACEEDGDKIYLSSPASSELLATKSEAVLLQDNADELAIAFTWTKSTVTISDESMGVADDQITTYLEISATEDFSGDVTEAEVTGLQKSYTVAELNTLATNAGLQPEVAGNVYFRLAATTGSNINPVHSNVVTVRITTYRIDMSIGFILDGNKDMTDMRLSSPTENGVYTGFMGVTAWYNFYLMEGDGTIWGENAEMFEISTASNIWNLWFPSPAGSYYVIIDTPAKEWSALYLPELTVSGDIAGEMTFDRPNNRWIYVFNATSTGSRTIRLNTTGKLFNHSVGDNADAAIDTPVAFSQDGDRLTIELNGQGGSITVAVPETGDCTLIVDLNDPHNWVCTITSGIDESDDIPEVLYLPGIDDLISGAWTFDNYVTLYDEDKLNYAGVFHVNSEWGYTIHTEYDNWNDKYTWISGDAYAGTIAFKDENNENIPAPAPGVYVIDISTKELTYELLALENTIYLVGLNTGENDEWLFDTLLPLASPGVYSGSITIEKASAWGFAISLFNNDWNHQFGGSDGKLYYQGGNITDDANLAPGTYTMTVDLINETYTIE